MKKYRVVETNNYNYSLQDDWGILNNLNIELIDTNEKIEVNNIITLSEKLIKEKNIYTFGPVENNQDSTAKRASDEIMILEKENKKICFQRYYG